MKKSQLLFLFVCLLIPSLSWGQVTGVTEVSLTFTPTGGGTPVVATATDNGQGLTPDGPINLVERTEYTLSIGMLAGTTDLIPAIQAEDTSYLFYFGWTDSVMASPAGDGNIDMRTDPMDYQDMDANMQPIGLSTLWEPDCGENALVGEFQVLLAYQMGTKTDMSASTDGVQVFDITWDLNVALDPNAPPCENEEEVITDVTLTFVSTDGDTVIATAVDPDGPGALGLVVQDTIQLLESAEYTMSITVFNSIEGEDITEEIEEEAEDHQFFFAFTDEVFTSPAGDGNEDNFDDPINYNDMDLNMRPVGLSTDWETDCGEEAIEGTFKVILKHQPGIKSDTSTVDDGETDFDLTWQVVVNLDPNAPPCENEEELITNVTLIFVPTAGGDTVFATATDPDGPGALDLAVDSAINLIENTEYEMSIELFNSIEGEDITEEIEEEDDEHQFFFAWTGDLFSDPMGDGNVDNRDDSVRYVDFDENNLPVGLSTIWTTSASVTGEFQVILKHQPDLKSDTTSVNAGGTDVDLTWTLGTVTSVRQDLQSSASLKLWPNPASNLIRWEIESLDRKADRLQVLDMYGRVVLESNDPQQELSIAQLAKGNYMLIVDQDNKRWVKRFVKMN
ncbi:T9SS type A sorting domain-containing protein [Okeania hirsuta]|uniref:T9SS type A sorting domain-containing protein n=1 Tax=Okeania hirsuta TaxID=1458930 RepID=UPI000F5361BD|nr:T9SS type A sorting domain-containing protein [Okeania hirsuta]RQH19332.1 T9SS C-terminal target domain-containing protein [Okeania hirsuta]